MRVITVLATVYLIASGMASNAQQRKFTSAPEAVKFINETCNKYWLKNLKEGDISRDITVYQHGCQLIFNEKTITKKLAPTESPEKNDVYHLIVSVKLAGTKLTSGFTSLEFEGGAKDIVTLAYHGNSELNNKGEFSNRYRVPLDYDNPAMREVVFNLTNATTYLLSECHPNPPKTAPKKGKARH